MKRKTEIILLFSFMTLLLCFSIYYTINWFVEYQVPIPFIDESKEIEYVSYEDGGQQYGIDAYEMVRIINIVGSRE